MLKRTLVFSSPMILSLKNQQLVYAFKDTPNEKFTVPIEDVGVVLLENQQTNITLPLLNALAESEVQVVICNNKGMPSAMIQSMDSNNLQGETLRNQISCGEVLKKQLWKQVVEAKIKNQASLLNNIGEEGDILKPFYSNVRSGDVDNREGIAARIYFQHLFGDCFVRNRDEMGINALLNYGYSILRAATCRAIVSSGLLPAIGIHHHNRSNAYPLADDLMEPFRPFVDGVVYDLVTRGQMELTKEVKGELISVLYADTKYEKIIRPLSVGLSMTTASMVKCLSKELNTISLPAFT
ncbi:MAG: type II CRISPR-associated endonuclease Cas1 [Prevotella sp.]|nr:type II CRISPR-associated endonuclease Cas1 [Prevotella sp.]